MLIPVSREAFLPLLLLSLLAGLVLGAVYDVFRIRRVAFRLMQRNPGVTDVPLHRIRRHAAMLDVLLCFGEDLVFCLLGTVVLILLSYQLSYGMPRWYALGASLLGFGLYRITLGRVVMSLAETILRGIRAVVRFFCHRLLAPVIGHIREWLLRGYRRRIFRRELAYTKAEEARMLACFSPQSSQKEGKTE